MVYVDIFVSIVDFVKELLFVIVNIMLFIFVVDYFVDKVFCYVFDDGVVMLIFEVLFEILEFVWKWVFFCKKFNIEFRVFEVYFVLKIDYLKDRV